MTRINDLLTFATVSKKSEKGNVRKNKRKTAPKFGPPKPKQIAPMPRRPKNADVRTREHLEPSEVDALMKATEQGSSRYPLRDKCMVLLAARHGLRVSELVATRWDQIEFKALRYFVRRVKRGQDSMHILEQDEIRLLRRLYAEQRNKAREETGNPDNHSLFVFETERGGPMTPSNFRKMIKVLGVEAGIPFPVHPHQLRHACGFQKTMEDWNPRHLQHWLGHQNIRHTMHYCNLTDKPFEQYFVQGARVRRHER